MMKVYILYEGHVNPYGQVLSEKTVNVYSCIGQALSEKLKREKASPYTDYWIKEWRVEENDKSK